ncbi:Gfo/Idh/MocA family protein [Wenxinia saemankumensis]|uniref:Predicted dehydrogenase n=1 Tax=Wenxinia saemankumensis TaxID=1447782 RepID=A0A1M6A998_9RHOB|nr:Gfo/Idh/MocA family oxidoreductase [Wenxinia saemankumensis]SHI33019.1 Predicted dehydrogenase [Wenxinia saemankumensis]
MIRELRYGLIGAGMMGREHIRNIALVEGARVAALHDPVPENAAAAAVLAGGAAVEESVAALVAREDLDAFVIVSPNHHHLDQIRMIAAAGPPRPILVEKPLFTRADEAETVRRFADSYPAPVWVAMEYRYMPPIAALVRDVDAATGGPRMLTIREHRFPFLPKVGDWNRFNAQTGGTLVEKCCHFFDLMRLILRADPVRVMASGGQAVNHLDESYGGRAPDIWDHAYAIVDFEGGARAMLELCMFAEGARYQEEVWALGPAGKIEAHVPGPSRFWPVEAGPLPMPRVIRSPRSPKGPAIEDFPIDPALLAAGDHNGSTYFQHLRFAQAVRGGGPVEVTLADGAWAVRMGLAAQESAATGQAVTF